MSYEAAFWRPGDPRLPRDEALSSPELARYIEGWGRPGDAAVVAVDRASGNGVGAAWYRLMTEDAPGYGFVAPEAPELGMGVAAAFRGHDVGRGATGGTLGKSKGRGLRRPEPERRGRQPGRPALRAAWFSEALARRRRLDHESGARERAPT
jgi:hypothetical protein